MKISSEQKPVILYNRQAVYTEQDCACADEPFLSPVLYTHKQQSVVTDCACADTGLVFVAQVKENTSLPWQISPELYRAPLSDGYELVFNPISPAGVAVLNSPARAVLNSFNHPGFLKNDPVHYQLAGLGLIHPHQSPPPEPLTEAHTLTAWLHLTNQCNFDCTYCYLTKTAEAMDEVTGLAALETVFRSAARHGFKAVKLKYAGGEPTLNFSLLQILHQHARRLSEHSGLALREVILTNGARLTGKMLAYLRCAGIRLMISLDGGSSGHNRHRMFINGKDTFTAVTQTIDRAIEYGLKPHLSITVTKDNAGNLAEAVQFALERELLFNLNFYRPEHGRALQADNESLITNVRAAFGVIEKNLPRYNLIAGLLDRADFSSPHYHPCGAGRNYLVIDQHGRIAPCQMEITRTVTDIHQPDPLAIVRHATAWFYNPPVSEKEDCRACQWRFECAGGCPLLSTSTRSPYCSVYQALFPELLRLEGMRLLKWQSTG